MATPVLILDIDGVISPILQAGATIQELNRNNSSWGDFSTHYLGNSNSIKLYASYRMNREIKSLDVDIVWLTDWGEMVDNFVTPRLNLPQGLEQLEWDVLSPPVHTVMSHILEYPRDFIWCYGSEVTEEHEDELIELADQLDIDCLLIKCEEKIGLLPGDFDDMRDFLAGNSNDTEEPKSESQE